MLPQTQTDQELDIKVYVSECGSYIKKEAYINGEWREVIYRKPTESGEDDALNIT